MARKFDKLDRFYIEEVNKILGGRKLKSLTEDDDLKTAPAADIDVDGQDQDENMAPMGDEEGTDGLDEADEILAEIDLDEVSTEGKMELIASIIDAAQNSMDDEEFSDFMQNLSDKIEEFRYEGEEGEEAEDMGGEGEGEMGMETPELEAPVEAPEEM